MVRWEWVDKVELTDVWGEPDRVWSANGKWSGMDLNIHVRIHTSFHREVVRRGCLVVDGLVTVAAKPITDPALPEGAEALAATWLRQCRGLAFESQRGVMLRLTSGQPWVHGQDIASALRTAKRRAIPAEELAETASRRAQRLAERVAARDAAISEGRWAEVWPNADFDNIEVCISDSIRAGNCPEGTEEWVARWMPPEYEGKEKASARAVLEAASRDRTTTRRLAVAAVHRAILRSRKTTTNAA